MGINRRTIIRAGVAGVAGFAVSDRMGARAQSTPSATPVAGSGPYLVTADVLAAQRDTTQSLAIMPAKAFDAQRIPGSILLDWAELALAETSEASVASWTDAMRELIAVRGIRGDRPVTVYDEGTLFAARGWWQLAYLGYDLPTVLDGGLPAWDAIHAPVESGPVAIAPVEAPQPEAMRLRRDILATKDDVLAALDDPDVTVLDVRSPKEYGAGHIPGARNLPYTDNAIPASPPFFKSSDELREMYAAVGVTPDQRVITYCSTGVRGSVGFFSLTLAGFEDVALYVGSWTEWAADPDTPKEPESNGSS